MFRRVTAFVSIVLIGLFLTPAVASAGTGNGVCDEGEMCLYEHRYLDGGLKEFRCDSGSCTIWTFTQHRYNSGVALNDTVSSMWNRTSKPASLFIAAPPDPGGPGYFTVWQGRQEKVLSWEFNDQFSSMLIG